MGAELTFVKTEAGRVMSWAWVSAQDALWKGMASPARLSGLPAPHRKRCPGAGAAERGREQAQRRRPAVGSGGGRVGTQDWRDQCGPYPGCQAEPPGCL